MKKFRSTFKASPEFWDWCHFGTCREHPAGYVSKGTAWYESAVALPQRPPGQHLGPSPCLLWPAGGGSDLQVLSQVMPKDAFCQRGLWVSREQGICGHGW